MTFDRIRNNKYIVNMRKVRMLIEKKKKFIALVLAATFLVSIPQAAELAWATSAEDKKEEAEENLIVKLPTGYVEGKSIKRR